MKLSRISLAILPLLSLCSVQAAVYNVVEIGDVPQLKSTYASAINDAGDTVFNGAIKVVQTNITFTASSTVFQYFNFPIRLDAIDFDDATVQAYFTDEQLADVTNGNINAAIQDILLFRNPAGQPIGQALSYVQLGSANPQNVPLRDTDLERGNSEYLYDINNAGVAVGAAGTTFTLQSFTPAPTETVPEPSAVKIWLPKATYQAGIVLKDGMVQTLAAPYQEFGGGFTVANSISNDGRIAGFGSVGMTQAIQDVLIDGCNGNDAPVMLCYYNNTIPNSSRTTVYNQRALVWQLQPDGSVSAPQVLGYLGEKNTGLPYEDSAITINYESYNQARAINSKGIAVGHSMYSDSDRKIRYQFNAPEAAYRQAHASLFVDGKVLPMVDPAEWFFLSSDFTQQIASSAVDINEKDIAIGYASKVINGGLRAKLFYHDYHSGKTTFQTGFFNSSSTLPSAINDNNQVVGRGEVIIGGTTTRRSHGFIYDITTDSFRDLNTLIACNSPYTIVDAKDINNNGVIVATALVTKEKRDSLGAVVLNAQGTPEKEDVATVVKLQPIANGTPEKCGSEQTEYKRQGGSSGFGTLLIGAALLWWRRRKV
jgi:hypothetical protein